MLKEHLWPHASSQLKAAWSAYLLKHFAQSSAGPSANPSKVVSPPGPDCLVGLVVEVPIEIFKWLYKLHKPVSFVMLMLASSDASQ